MTKAQALAAMNALEAAQMAGSARLAFPSPGVTQWSILLDPAVTYTGAQLSSIAAYCASNGLTLSATFQALGIV